MYILNHYTMKTFIQCIIFAILTFTSPFLDAQEKIIVCPNELQQEWANAEIGVIIHFDMPVFHPDYNWRQFGTHPSPSTFNPSSLDTDQWIHTAKSLGAKYAVLVAKHCSGFSLWPTKAHEYSIKNSPYKKAPVRERYRRFLILSPKGKQRKRRTGDNERPCGKSTERLSFFLLSFSFFLFSFSIKKSMESPSCFRRRAFMIIHGNKGKYLHNVRLPFESRQE